jgi:hypothetical protein
MQHLLYVYSAAYQSNANQQANSCLSATWTGPCSVQHHISWATIIPNDTWWQTAAMQNADRGAGAGRAYDSFCVSHVLLGGKRPGCNVVHHDGFNTPDNPVANSTITAYPGSMLQVPLCRAMAASIGRMRYAPGLHSSMLLSQAVLNNTMHDGMAGEPITPTRFMLLLF